MLIYRVEHPESKRGPFTHSWKSAFFNITIYGRSKEYPSMQEEFGRELYGWHSGCKSMGLLAHWFCNGQALRALREDGMVVAVYEVACPMHGKYQSLFVPETATLVETLPLDVIAAVPLREARLAA